MRTFRGNLTRLKNRMETVLPDGDDIYGYAGFNKQVLVDSVGVAYSLSLEIEERDDETRFEVLALKRVGARALKSLNKFLEEEVGTDKAAKRFDVFLNSLSEVIEKTKNVFFIVNKNGLRDDQEIADLRAELSQTRAALSEYESLLEEVKPAAESAQEHLTAVKDASEYCTAVESKMTSLETGSTEVHSRIKTIGDNADEWSSKFAGHSGNFDALEKKYGNLTGQLEKLAVRLKENVERGETSAEALNDHEEKNEALVEEIQATLGDANRLGMSFSFKERKEELVGTQRTWQWVFIVSLLAASGVAYMLFHAIVGSSTIKLGTILFRLSIMTPLVWLAWFAAVQYGYTSKVREDYSFKYAAAMAYEGYKKAASDVNPELEQLLLEFLLFNMSLNPLRVYDKKPDAAVPLQAVTETILERLQRFKKITVEPPGVGRVTVEVGEIDKTEDESVPSKE